MQVNNENNNKMLIILLIQHQIIERIMKYDKEFKPKEYNKKLKSEIETLLKMEKDEINDLF